MRWSGLRRGELAALQWVTPPSGVTPWRADGPYLVGAGIGSFRTFWGWDAQGSIDPSYSAEVSTVGTIGTQVGFLSADPLANVGSLGTAILVPGPGVAAAAVLALAIRSRRRA